MPDDGKRRDKGRAGLAFPARYVQLGRVSLETPGRRAILVIGALIILGLILLALLGS